MWSSISALGSSITPRLRTEEDEFHPQHEQIPMKDWADNVNWVEADQFFPHLDEDH